MRRNVNRKVYNDRKNVSETAASRPRYNDVVVLGIRLHVGFVGLQQRWSVRPRTCLSLVQRYYDIILKNINGLILLFYRFANWRRILLCINY